MRVLVIPDIHQRIVKTDSILTAEEGNYDKVVFLGDYFDSFFFESDILSNLRVD